MTEIDPSDADPGDAWTAARAELDRWRAEGRIARLWLRDDDAVEPTPALEALRRRMRSYGAPCLLAVIPLLVTPALAEHLRSEPLMRIAMHGIRHANHAPAGRKTEETPVERGLDLIREELDRGRNRLVSLFGAEAGRWYVPPWNRIDREAAGLLPGLGFAALSGFGARRLDAAPELRELNTHVDLIDWKGGRVGKPPAAIAADLAAALAQARQNGWRPVGVLAHHLAHDAQAWETLDELLALTASHPAAEWRAADALLDEA